MKIGKEIEIKTTEELSIVAVALTKHRKKKSKRNIFRNIFCWIFKRQKPVYRYNKPVELPSPPPLPSMEGLPSGALRTHQKMELRRIIREVRKQFPDTEFIDVEAIEAAIKSHSH